MTIKLLAPYGKYRCNDIVTLDGATEAALIAAGQATATLTGGTTWVDINADDAPSALTDAEDAWVRSSVSGGGSYTLATVGDSLTAQGFYSSATQVSHYARGFVPQALALSGHRLTLISQNAVGGSRITSAGAGAAFADQMTAAIASGASDILMLGGVNDLINDVPLATVQATYTTLIDAALAAGRRLWLCTPPGLSAANGSYTAARRAAIFEFGRWMRDRVSGVNDRAVVIDTAGVVVDPSSTSGDWRASTSPEGLHPLNVGAYLMGKAVAAAWTAKLPSWDRRLTSNADNYTFNAASRNIAPNGLFVTGAAPGTGWTVAYTGSGAGTASLAARSDGFGNDLAVALTAGLDGNFFTVNTANLLANGVSVGDSITWEAEVTFSAGPVNIKNVRAFLLQSGGTSVLSEALSINNAAADDLAYTESFTVLLRTPPQVILSGATTLQGYVRCVMAGNPTGTTVKVGRASMRKLYGAY